MKIFKYLFATIILGLTISACHDLDLKPKGLLDEATLFRSDDGVKKYLASIYNDLPIEDFNYKHTGGGRGYSTDNQNGHHNGQYWEAQKGSASTAAGEVTGREGTNGDGWGYWPYGTIRNINVFIEAIPNYANLHTEERITEYIAEARFLRAFYYFGMVKRYGGVPIVDEVLNPKTPLEELRVPRDTEYDCWKFIYDDLKFAMDNMPKTSVVGRANRYAAAALMSRAMLFAATNAKYGAYIVTKGPATETGLMGMPVDKAQEFFQYSYDASKFIKEGGYRLHTGADKEKAYTEVFIEDLNGTEDIFVKQYGPEATTPWNMRLRHSWDTMVLPRGEGLAQSVGAAIHPVWDLVGMYELPKIINDDGTPVRFERIEDIWDNNITEPRARANFFFPGMTETVTGVKIDIQTGVYTEFPGDAADATPEAISNDYTEKYRKRANQPGKYQKFGDEEIKVSGEHGFAEGVGDEGYSTTGVMIRKYVDYKATPATRELFRSSQPWKVFRYGEILCNWAEAAYELGLITNSDALKREAFEHVNELRDRAGATAHAMVAAPEDIGTEIYGFEIDENLQYIRDERLRELCLENMRWWDIRRWKIADVMFTNHWPRILSSYYVVSEKKYIFLNEVEFFERKSNFDKRWYYEQIPGGEIGKNPNLIRNDGY